LLLWRLLLRLRLRLGLRLRLRLLAFRLLLPLLRPLFLLLFTRVVCPLLLFGASPFLILLLLYALPLLLLPHPLLLLAPFVRVWIRSVWRPIGRARISSRRV